MRRRKKIESGVLRVPHHHAMTPPDIDPELWHQIAIGKARIGYVPLSVSLPDDEAGETRTIEQLRQDPRLELDEWIGASAREAFAHHVQNALDGTPRDGKDFPSFSVSDLPEEHAEEVRAYVGEMSLQMGQVRFGPRPRSAENMALSWLRLVLPKRMYEEEVGDAYEVLADLSAADSPRWQRWLKVGTTISWALINAARYIVSGETAKG